MCVPTRNAAGELEIAMMPAFAAGGPLPKQTTDADEQAWKPPPRKPSAAGRKLPKPAPAPRPQAAAARQLPSELLPPPRLGAAASPGVLPLAKAVAASLARARAAVSSATAAAAASGMQSAPKAPQSGPQPVCMGAPLPGHVTVAAAAAAHTTGVSHGSSIAPGLARPAPSPAAARAAAPAPDAAAVYGVQGTLPRAGYPSAPCAAPAAKGWLPAPELAAGRPAACSAPKSAATAASGQAPVSDAAAAPAVAEVPLHSEPGFEAKVEAVSAPTISVACPPPPPPQSSFAGAPTPPAEPLAGVQPATAAAAAPLPRESQAEQLSVLAAQRAAVEAALCMPLDPGLSEEFAFGGDAGLSAVDPFDMQGMGADGMDDFMAEAPLAEPPSDPVDMFLNDGPST